VAMRLAALALALLGMIAAGPAARAQTRLGFEIGPEVSWYNYRESGLNIVGQMAGLQGSWTVAPLWLAPILFLRLELNADGARVDYSSTLSGANNGIWDFKGEARALTGIDVTLPRRMVFTPYAGIGYRALYDMEGGTQTTRVPPSLGYNRLSQYFYIPVGFTWGFGLGSWTFKPNFEADYLVQGWQTSYLRGVGFDSNITNTQHNGYGFRGKLMFETETSLGVVSVGPYFRYWKIGQSQSASLFSGGKYAGSAFEPSNHTLETGLAFLISF
jgi:hypothetical protein